MTDQVVHAESPPDHALNCPPLPGTQCAESPPRKTYSLNTYRIPIVARGDFVDKSPLVFSWPRSDWHSGMSPQIRIAIYSAIEASTRGEAENRVDRVTFDPNDAL